MRASDVPFGKDDAFFLLAEEERLRAIDEARAADSPEAQLEATLVAISLWTAQLRRARDLAKDIQKLSQYDPERAQAAGWFVSWADNAAKGVDEWADFQEQLVEQLGRERAREIGDGRAQPRLDAVVEQARRDELRDRGIDPDEIDSALQAAEPPTVAGIDGGSEGSVKTCPDCAEEVKAAARKCRFCGYRFDGAESSPE